MARKRRIPQEELEFDDEVRCYKGEPFSGIGYEEYPNGSLKSETEYRDGFQCGSWREWYPNGQLSYQLDWKYGERFSRETRWYEDGAVKSVANHEWGIEVDFKEWDPAGKLAQTRSRDDSDPLLVRMRGGATDPA